MISSTCSIRWRPSPRPDPTFSFAAERSDGQGWLKAIAKRLALDGREHSGRLVRSGEAGLWCWDSLSRYVSVGNGRRYRGELAIRRTFAPQTCIRSIREDHHHDAVMRIGGEAPRRRAHMSRPIRIASPHGSSRATDAAAAFGRIPTKMRPPSRGGSGNKLNTANTTLIINAFFKLSTSHCALVAGR